MSADDLHEFGSYRLDPRDGVLYRGEERVPLTPKVFETLRTLVENSGRVVSKDELMQRVWPDTFVEEGNLTVNIFLLRKELGEGTKGAKYIETVPKRGYRFVAPVRQVPRVDMFAAERLEAEAPPVPAGAIAPAFSAGTPAAVNEAPVLSPEHDKVVASTTELHGGLPPLAIQRAPTSSSFRERMAIAGLLVIAASIVAWLVLRPAPPLKVTRVIQLTHIGTAVSVATDGARLYVNRTEAGRRGIVQFPIDGGEPVPLATPFRNVRILDIFPRRSELLVSSFDTPGDPQLLWALPTVGGSPRRVGNVLCEGAKWSQDGKTIVFGGEDGALYVVNDDGANPRKLTDQGGRVEEWSPDGRWVRFTRTNGATGGTTMWEIQLDGTHLRQFLPERQNPNSRWGEGQCCGQWTPDGKLFLFREAFYPKVGLWAIQEKQGLLEFHRPEPVEVYAAGFDILNFVVDPNGNRLFLVGQNDERELVRLDSRLRQFVPLLEGIGANAVRWSPGGEWLAYNAASTNCLWRAKPDGSERTQLTFPPMQVFSAAWSPDGKRLAFHSLPPGKLGKICLISSQGGTPEVLLADQMTVEDDPNWSGDGGTLMIHRFWVDKDGNTTRAAICQLELKTNRVTELPGSEDLGPPSWSPDGRYVAAQSGDFRKLMLFDFRSHKWTDLAHGAFINAPQWTHDSRFIVYQDAAAGEDQFIYRIPAAGGKAEEIAGRKNLLRADVNRFRLVSLDPNDQPVAVVIRRNADVYGLDLGTSE